MSRTRIRTAVVATLGTAFGVAALMTFGGAVNAANQAVQPATTITSPVTVTATATVTATQLVTTTVTAPTVTVTVTETQAVEVPVQVEVPVTVQPDPVTVTDTITVTETATQTVTAAPSAPSAALSPAPVADDPSEDPDDAPIRLCTTADVAYFDAHRDQVPDCMDAESLVGSPIRFIGSAAEFNQVPVPNPFTTADLDELMACDEEDASTPGQVFPCVWRADIQGNGQGDWLIYLAR